MKKNNLILEFTEFNLNRYNSPSTRMSIQVDNPSLSIGAFDKHEDAIRTGVARINDILHTLSGTSQFRALKAKLSLEDQQLSSLKVMRIVSNDHVNYDFYVGFQIGEKEYYGVIKNLTGKNPDFSSEVFKDFEDLIQTKEWIIRLKGLIIKTLKKWLRPEEGVYELINDQIYCNSIDTGNRIVIKKGEKVELITSFESKIVIKYRDLYYNLSNDNFIYYNYWFTKIDD